MLVVPTMESLQSTDKALLDSAAASKVYVSFRIMFGGVHRRLGLGGGSDIGSDNRRMGDVTLPQELTETLNVR